MREESVFKALSDEQRRKILRLLRDGEKPAGAIAGSLDITSATLSHHLAILKQADLVRVQREGQQRIYSLNTSMVETAMGLLLDLLGKQGG